MSRVVNCQNRQCGVEAEFCEVDRFNTGGGSRSSNFRYCCSEHKTTQSGEPVFGQTLSVLRLPTFSTTDWFRE
jgi:hypothetical protein